MSRSCKKSGLLVLSANSAISNFHTKIYLTNFKRFVEQKATT